MECQSHQIYGPRHLSGTGSIGVFAYGGMVGEALELKRRLGLRGKRQPYTVVFHLQIWKRIYTLKRC